MALQAAEIPVRYGTESRLSYTSYTDVEDNLPKDPRTWSREHVARWLDHVTSQHGLPQVSTSKFLMNGKALCLMSPGMFLSRVPVGGKLLYKDFQLRLCSALYNSN
ncbi:transcription factor ETV7 isoform X2 [Aethina tumida]|nr:transcription factor ETV7 isoform X2 [Aethina tumida]XP_019871855.1 transcription factor ETV7 isoform X2 [Aethina tumida]